MRSILQWVKGAARGNRVFRTFVQGACGYLVVSIPTVLEGGGDLALALRALLIGAIAAGISAAWSTSEDLEATQQAE